jgi:hypothetical protein
MYNNFLKERKLEQQICLIVYFLLIFIFPTSATSRQKLNFNGGWLLKVGDFTEARNPSFDDAGWKQVTLPYAFNESEAFRVSIENLTDTVMWYRKHFTVDEVSARKYFIEFEGVRFGAEVWLNGRSLGITENGVMASGFDLTPYIKKGENVIAVRVDNDWHYKERATGTAYEWNDRNFNANYGGIPKNVFLHITGMLHQTLPLYSNLKTVGTYIYGSDYDIKGKTVLVHAETEVANEDSRPRSFRYFFTVTDAEGKKAASFDGGHYILQPGGKRILKAQGKLADAHFWSWGYGYLYTVNTVLLDDKGTVVDSVSTRTGFRKTHFGGGMFYLNDRELMIHGYAQRTSNEWPGVGMSVPAWLSDYSNHLMVQSCGNLVRWMHVCPWKQDVESCDRVGLLEAMPAGDAERDAKGRQWEQRCELMRDAIIYNRNNPSIIFYEGGNRGVSAEHLRQLAAIRNQYDPNGGRAVGAREMMNVPEAEYGGEMMYINKSNTHPMWCMEYDRDEGLRKYWDNWSYPYHQEGEGPLYRGKPAREYNHNQDELAKSMVRSWYDYFVERPGTGSRVNNGGVKIVFSDTNTHHRGESNYRTSGVVDPMRVPKDAYYVHQVIWDGWVTSEKDSSYIIGHWNYKEGTVKPVYVVSTGDEVELLLNGISLGKGRRSKQWLFTFAKVPFEPGTLEAVSYRDGKVVSRTCKVTAGKPDHLKLTKIENPLGFKADGADMALLQIEVVDKDGRRCPLDNRMIHFNCWGEVQWIGGIAQRTGAGLVKTVRHGGDGLLDAANTETVSDNYINSINVPVECGVNRVLIRSTVHPGDITVAAGAEGMRPVTLTLSTQKVDESSYLPAYRLKGYLTRGETPQTPSFVPLNREIFVKSVQAGSNAVNARLSCDGDETTEWKSDGKKANAWITYTLEEKTRIDQLTLKLTGWRNHIYPLQIFEGKKLVWQGNTYPTLGYVHIRIARPVKSERITIKMVGPSSVKNADSDTAELAGGKANSFDGEQSARGRVDLRIVEVDFLQKIK